MKLARRHSLVVALLYGLTWVGGYYTHKRALSGFAQRLYVEAQDLERKQAALRGGSRITRDGGPFTRINWCVPVLPGILLADSEYTIGPRYGQGGLSILVYYGVGCLQFGPIIGWIS